MDNNIKACFTDQVISLCAKNYNISFYNLEPLGDWQNMVFGYKKDGKSYIMRITHETHRSRELIQEELDFIIYLNKNGVNASTPILSDCGNYIESVTLNGSVFHTVCFIRAIGQEWIFNQDSIFKIGEMTGLIHSLSKQYTRDVRYHWFDNGYLKEHKIYIPEKYSLVIENTEKLVKQMHQLPKSDRNFGLIHGDINGRNYLVNNECEITLFDFDECQLDWYVDDIVIQLFYYTYVFEDVYERASFFMSNFIKGYRKYYEFTKSDIEIMPLLFQMRELIVFTGACRGLDMENLDTYTQRFVDRLSLMGNPLYIDISKVIKA